MSADFLRLQAEWDARLKASGFRDLESRKHDHLNVHHDTPEERAKQAEHEAYLDAARDYLRRSKTLRGKDRKLWAMHADGYSEREIARALAMTKSLVHKRVKRYRARMLRGVEWSQRMHAKAGRDGNIGRSAWVVALRMSDAEATVFRRWAKERGVPCATLARDLIFGRRNATGAPTERDQD